MEILAFLTKALFWPVLLLLVTLVALVFSVRYYQRYRHLRVFAFYIFISLLIDIADIWKLTSSGLNQETNTILRIFDNVFLVFEFLVFSLFILYCVRGRSRKLTVKIIIFLFLGLVFLISAVINSNFVLSFKTAIAESILLVFPCLIYYYELFITVTNRPLNSDPSFWVITGIFFLNACSIPLLLIFRLLGSFSHIAFTLNYVLYCILFILLIRAYCCRPF